MCKYNSVTFFNIESECFHSLFFEISLRYFAINIKSLKDVALKKDILKMMDHTKMYTSPLFSKLCFILLILENAADHHNI